MGAFESQLEEEVLLAFFVPSVVYMADAVGTQTEAIVIRGLAVGVRPAQIVVRELVTGVLIGVVIGVAFLPLAWVAWGSGPVAVAVSLALFASCAVATLVAMGLPFLLQRLGRDPAARSRRSSRTCSRSGSISLSPSPSFSDERQRGADRRMSTGPSSSVHCSQRGDLPPAHV